MTMNKSVVIGILAGAVAAVILVTIQQGVQKLINPVHETKELTLLKYAIPILRETQFPKSKIFIQNPVQKNPNIYTYTFYFYDGGKKVSGLLNAPKQAGEYPVLILFRGYVDKEIYQPGVGTQRAAEYFAHNGFITLSPDFLGYGTSDQTSTDSLESRFQTYTTALSLLSSLENLNEALPKIDANIKANTENIGIWGHSNGGQIAITALEVTGEKYPLVLWAPVTEAFPESILYFVDEMEDGGKYLRGIVGEFVQNYNVRLYSPPQFVRWLNAPVQLQQGTADDAVPLTWSNTFVKKLDDLNKPITYYIYEGEDHNFTQGNWTTLVTRDLEFYRKHLNL